MSIVTLATQLGLVKLEARELTDAQVLRTVAPERRLITWRGRAQQLEDAYRCITRTPARLYRLEVETAHCAEALLPLQLLKREGRDDVTAYATGATGFWTRVLAPLLGAPVTFERLDDYGMGDGFAPLPRIEKLFGIAGHPALQSLSPKLHNDGFRRLGIPALYLPFDVADFGDFWTSLISGGGLASLGFDVGALTVVSPHKEVALAAAGAKTPMVGRARSSNFFVNDGGLWTAATTDAEGVLLTLRERGVDPRNQRVAVVGCGGSGRVIAAALQHAGADVTLVNRGYDRASLAVRLLQLPFMPLASFSPRGYHIVVNATPVGRAGELPFDMAALEEGTVVVDLVYGSEPTPLVASQRARGQVAIDGLDVLRMQAAAQFRLMTGQAMPAEVLATIGGAHPELAARIPLHRQPPTAHRRLSLLEQA
ncbi:MAG TPA: 2-dehydropantoate 2-reductase N-terminal domain-containing protein [Thermoanaerobaculia bacterium]|jgi:3-dehydroquinate dehydratase/shikimate dehydrogenase